MNSDVLMRTGVGVCGVFVCFPSQLTLVWLVNIVFNNIFVAGNSFCLVIFFVR